MCGSQTNIISVTWELVRNAASQFPPGIYWVRTCRGGSSVCVQAFLLSSHCDLFTNGGMVVPCIEQGYLCHFSSSVCSLHASVPHFGNSHNMSEFFIIIIFKWWSVMSDLWSYYYHPLKVQMMVVSIAIKIFLIKALHCFLDKMLLHTW